MNVTFLLVNIKFVLLNYSVITNGLGFKGLISLFSFSLFHEKSCICF